MSTLESRAHVTEATLEYRLLGAAYFILLGLAGWAVLALVISGIQGSDFKEGASIAFRIILGICMAIFIGQYVSGIRNRGRVIQDCGPNPVWKHTAVSCSLFVFGFLFSFTSQGINGTTQINLLCLIVMFFLLSISHVQLCENGIMHYVSLIKWNHIKSHEWVDNGSLVIEKHSRFPQPRTVIFVPPIHRSVMEKAIAQHR